jgi:hypothetical protein
VRECDDGRPPDSWGRGRDRLRSRGECFHSSTIGRCIVDFRDCEIVNLLVSLPRLASWGGRDELKTRRRGRLDLALDCCISCELSWLALYGLNIHRGRGNDFLLLVLLRRRYLGLTLYVRSRIRL